MGLLRVRDFTLALLGALGESLNYLRVTITAS